MINITENVNFIPIGRKFIKTNVWNKNELSPSEIRDISMRNDVEITPMDPNDRSSDRWGDVWMKTRKDNIEGLIKSFIELNDNYSAEELKDMIGM